MAEAVMESGKKLNMTYKHMHGLNNNVVRYTSEQLRLKFRLTFDVLQSIEGEVTG